MIREVCPKCGSEKYKKNGHIHNGKQNYRCKECGRQFVIDYEFKDIKDFEKELINKALLERNSLRGICRIFSVSLTWLLGYLAMLYTQTPDDLGFKLPLKYKNSKVQLLFVEADEMWSFVGNKENKQWIWLAMDVGTRQIIAFHIGGRGKADAEKLWQQIPEIYREKAYFFTDYWNAYACVLPKNRHAAVGKHTGLTNHIERFNLTMRQRVSRLVRSSLSFSKNIENHIAAIKFFLFHYNLSKAALLV
jgi:insertion element IS1 protein InsB